MTCRPDELSNLLGSWTTGSGTLVDDLVAALVELMDAGLLPAGMGLPAQRGLAQALGVSRGVVTAAYGLLEGRGYLISVQGSGSRVTSARRAVHARTSGRMFSFTSVPAEVIDLSTGALPASRAASDVLATGLGTVMSGYLATDGYFPAGLPILRQALADQLTRDGFPTLPQEVMVTSGAQQATWLAINSEVEDADRVLVQEPTYRGALEVLRGRGARLESVPMERGRMAPELTRRALARGVRLAYCQSGIHNPTGRALATTSRRALAAAVNEHGVVTIDDHATASLLFAEGPADPGLTGLVDPDLLVTIGSMSKPFWGGLRVGWVRASQDRIRGLVEVIKPVQMACSVYDQLVAVEMLRRADEARAERRTMLLASLAATEKQLRDAFPRWSWDPIDGGSGLWVDVGEDAVALAERAKRVGVRLVPGPAFSAHGGQRTMLRIPVWHEPEVLAVALERLREVCTPA